MIDNAGISARCKQFDLANGDDAIMVGGQFGWLVFSNGARREPHPLGTWMDPPKDPHERAKRIAEYWGEKLRRATEEFNTYRNMLLAGVSVAAKQAASNVYSSPPNEENLQHLRNLLETVRARQKDYDAARANVEATVPESVKRRELQIAENQRKTDEVWAVIKAIKI